MNEDMLEQLAVAVQGLTVDDVMQSLMASNHAAMLDDPMAVAAYLVSLAAGAQ